MGQSRCPEHASTTSPAEGIQPHPTTISTMAETRFGAEIKEEREGPHDYLSPELFGQ
jgi:hypothetical protein